MRVLVIGGSGQLGLALTNAFSGANEVAVTAHLHQQPGQMVLDLGDVAATTALLRRWAPDLMLVAGAMTHVDRCELEPDLCRRINVQGPAAIADYARQHGSRVVFISTDHVFDGAQPAYRESDPTSPLSVYARSKVEAEETIRDLIPTHHLIVRTGWVYGPDPQRRNFILRLIDRLRQGETVDVPADQAGSPTYTEDLARAVSILVERNETGTFHAVGPDFVDRAALSAMVCARFGLDARRIVPRPTSALGQAARRPLRVPLDCGKLRSAGVPAFRGIAAGLDALSAWSTPSGLYQQAR